jgi:PhnB protein
MTPKFYLHFKGNCLEAMTHYAQTLDGKIERIVRNSDAPTPQDRMPGGDHLILNMTLRLGNDVMMASDCPTEWYETPQGFRVQIEPASTSEFDRIFRARAKDATRVDMPPGPTFWADRFTMFTDRFGTPWMLNFYGSKTPH